MVYWVIIYSISSMSKNILSSCHVHSYLYIHIYIWHNKDSHWCLKFINEKISVVTSNKNKSCSSMTLLNYIPSAGSSNARTNQKGIKVFLLLYLNLCDMKMPCLIKKGSRFFLFHPSISVNSGKVLIGWPIWMQYKIICYWPTNQRGLCLQFSSVEMGSEIDIQNLTSSCFF